MLIQSEFNLYHLEYTKVQKYSIIENILTLEIKKYIFTKTYIPGPNILTKIYKKIDNILSKN